MPAAAFRNSREIQSLFPRNQWHSNNTYSCSAENSAIQHHLFTVNVNVWKCFPPYPLHTQGMSWRGSLALLLGGHLAYLFGDLCGDKDFILCHAYGNLILIQTWSVTPIATGPGVLWRTKGYAKNDSTQRASCLQKIYMNLSFVFDLCENCFYPPQKNWPTFLDLALIDHA